MVLIFFGTATLGETFAEPSLNVQDLVVEKYVSDLCMITTMTFDDDILILQKNDGIVRLIRDGGFTRKTCT